jgi:WD40 repeat protein
MVDDQNSEGYEIISQDTNRELLLHAEIVKRGLELAKKIEGERAIEKCNKPILHFPGVLNRSCVTFSRNGEVAAITSHGKQKDNPGLVVWNMVNLVLSINPEPGFQVALPSFSLLERIIEKAPANSVVKISTSENRYKPVGDPESKPWDINCVALSMSGEEVLIGYYDGSKGYCDIKDGVVSQMRVIGKEVHGQLSAIVISPDGYAFAEAVGSIVRVWETKTGREIQRWEGHNPFYNQLSFSDDGRMLLIANCKGEKNWPACMTLVDINGNKPSFVYAGDRTGDISAVAISPDNQILASMNKGIVTVWSATSGQEISHWHHTTYEVNDIIRSYSGEDHVEIPYSDEYTIEMRANQSPPVVLRNPYIWGLSSIAISPDGKRILSGGGDNFMRLWTLNGYKLWEYPHESRVVKVAFHPDGHRALAGCWNGSVYIWELP